MKKPLLILAACVALYAADPFKNLGTITVRNGLMWDADTNAMSFRIYAGLTNETNFALVATVTTNRWQGSGTKMLEGWRAVYLTAVDAAGAESDPGETNLVRFRAGAPVPPTGMQIYTVVTAATNALPPLPQ